MEAILDLTMGRRRLMMLLLAVFAGVALALALVGIYGVTAYSVTQRTHEIGIRQALGARRGQILWLALKHSFLAALCGVCMGVSGAYAVTRVLEGFLYGVSPTDPPVFIAVALSFLAATAAASVIPAWGASRVDPIAALRVN